MSVRELAIAGYRSIRELELQPGPVTIIVGTNGCGKTNLHRCLNLLHAAAAGRLGRTIAEEGGMPSVLWAGARRKGPVRVRLAVTLKTLAYEVEFGLPTPDENTSQFRLDPRIKTEHVWVIAKGRKIPMLERDKTTAWARSHEGERLTIPHAIEATESVLSELREPARFPELAQLRQEFLSWRFYQQFRTDPAAPVRQPQIGVWTPVLDHDGRDLAAALLTILEAGDARALNEQIHTAFAGAELKIDAEGQRFTFGLKMAEFQHPFGQQQLSDGTIHYLCLIAALLSPRPPTLLALNEPETSVHPSLYPALADLIVRAARHSQLFVTTHSEVLSRLIEEKTGSVAVKLEKVSGETKVSGQGLLGPLKQVAD